MSIRTRSSLVAVLMTALVCASCVRLGVEGSGNVITESREVSGFNEIVLDGTGRVVVEVTGSESLTIEAEDNIMPLLETTVREGRLRLETNRSISPTVEIVYTITAATLDGLVISGSGVVEADAIDGFDAMTWRGLGMEGAWPAIGVQLAFAAVFALLAVWKFQREQRA